MAGKPGEYPWSSYRAGVGLSSPPQWPHREFILSLFVSDTDQKQYRKFVEVQTPSIAQTRLRTWRHQRFRGMTPSWSGCGSSSFRVHIPTGNCPHFGSLPVGPQWRRSVPRWQDCLWMTERWLDEWGCIRADAIPGSSSERSVLLTEQESQRSRRQAAG